MHSYMCKWAHATCIRAPTSNPSLRTASTWSSTRIGGRRAKRPPHARIQPASIASVLGRRQELLSSSRVSGASSLGPLAFSPWLNTLLRAALGTGPPLELQAAAEGVHKYIYIYICIILWTHMSGTHARILLLILFKIGCFGYSCNQTVCARQPFAGPPSRADEQVLHIWYGIIYHISILFNMIYRYVHMVYLAYTPVIYALEAAGANLRVAGTGWEWLGVALHGTPGSYELVVVVLRRAAHQTL